MGGSLPCIGIASQRSPAAIRNHLLQGTLRLIQQDGERIGALPHLGIVELPECLGRDRRGGTSTDALQGIRRVKQLQGRC
jgi:hypothetical protein